MAPGGFKLWVKLRSQRVQGPHHLADLVVVPRGDGRHSLDVRRTVDGLGQLLELLLQEVAGLHDALVDADGVRARA